MKEIVTFFIRAYQVFISSLLPPCCRFYPSCSSYTLEAIERFGLKKGLIKGMIRILSCHPFSLGGFDPVNIKSRNEKELVKSGLR